MNKDFQSRSTGQVLILVALSGAVLAILFLFLANLGKLGTSRTKTWSGTDMTSLSAATLYARGLNILSVSNKALVVSAAVDATILAVRGIDIKSRRFVQKAQDHFITAWNPVMLAGTMWVARQNRLRFGLFPPSPILLWNAEGSSPSLAPSLGVQRRTLWDLLQDGFKKKIERGEVDPEHDKDAYYYTDKDGNVHVFTDNQIESSGTYKNGNARYRVQGQVENTGKTSHKGKFVRRVRAKKQPGSEQPSGLLSGLAALGKDLLSQIDADISDLDTDVHSVLLYANRPINFWIGSNPRLSLTKTSSKFQHALAEAEAFGGSLDFWKLNAANYDARLRSISSQALGAGRFEFLGKTLSLAIRH